MKNVKGITLIALVVTIVLLIILAGVAISLTIGKNGLINKAKYSKEEYKLAQAREELELEIIQVQTKIMEEESRIATLEDLQNLIDTSKYEIILHYEPIASSESIAVKATYANVVKIGTEYKFTVDNKLVITNVKLVDIERTILEITEIIPSENNNSVVLKATADEDIVAFAYNKTNEIPEEFINITPTKEFIKEVNDLEYNQIYYFWIKNSKGKISNVKNATIEKSESNILPSNINVSSNYGSNTNKDYMTDNNLSTRWDPKDGEKSANAVFEMDNSIILSKIKLVIYCGLQNCYYKPDYDTLTVYYEFEGSNDNTTYKKITDTIQCDFKKTDPSSTYEIELINNFKNERYKYYRLKIESVQGPICREYYYGGGIIEAIFNGYTDKE